MTVEVNGLEIYYEISGHGHPLLMLHGNGEDGSIFGPLADKLSRQYMVYRIDSRNHGRSGRADDFSYDVMASDTVKLVGALGLDSPYVAGFSDGGIVALKAQLASPGLFGKMVLLGANLHPCDFRSEIYMQMEGQYHLNPDPLVKLMLTEPDINPLHLRRIPEKVLVIGGENDIFKPVTFTKLTDALRSARMKIMYGHDHSSYIVGSDLLYKTLDDFFRVR